MEISTTVAWDWPRRKSWAHRRPRITLLSTSSSHHSLRHFFPEGLTVIGADYRKPHSLESAMQNQEVISSGDAAGDQKDKVLADDINFNVAPLPENISKHFNAEVQYLAGRE